MALETWHHLHLYMSSVSLHFSMLLCPESDFFLAGKTMAIWSMVEQYSDDL